MVKLIVTAVALAASAAYAISVGAGAFGGAALPTGDMAADLKPPSATTSTIPRKTGTSRTSTNPRTGLYP